MCTTLVHTINNMNLHIKGLIVILAGLAMLSACAAPTPVNTNTTVANSNTSTPAQPQELEPEYSSVIVTLPIVDALMSDEEFRTRAQSELQLTDEELQKLSDVTRGAVLELDDENYDETTGSTAASARSAEEKLREALGPDKATRFLNMIRRHIGGSDAAVFAQGKPNSVPSDTRIVVNAPAYRMDVFENGQLKKSYKIGIGYPEFPLPVGLRKADTLIFNPTWTPPDEPWVKGKVSPGKTVEAGSKLNPLGIVKIPIGLPSLIHAGKAENRLGTFASHGCVGLTNEQARDFSLMLSALGGAELTETDIASYGKNKTETEEIKLTREIPVELRYETIVIEDGKLHILRDVYERGTNTEENLRRVMEAAGVSFDQLQPADKEKILAGLKQMAVDAKGKPVDEDANTNANKAKPNTSKTVTRNIKGEKRLTFELAELRGKGYPAPIGATF
jgi:lipoprotein-anchoring transpeptidase ErfK/SrfK